MIPVFEALADETRRALLERLRLDGPLPLSALAAGMPMTRQGVTKHLELLRAARLVRVERRGRERIHALDPQPLREATEWLAPYAARWETRIERLKQHLEE
ncbi:MAG: metalloregulator ArsR/SmtB family transcription factor [Gaiellaceae bacterium]